MATVLDRPPRAPGPVTAPTPSGRRPAATPTPTDAAAAEPRLLVAVTALLLTACFPLARVFIGLSFVWPVFGAGLLALGVGWACRRLALGPALSLVASTVAWAAYVSLAFLADTLVAGVLPTAATFAAGRELWARGLELLQARPSPAFAEAGLLLLAVNGVWAVAHAIDRLVFRLVRPVAAIVVALVMWTVPLVLAPPGAVAWLWATPLLMASAGMLLLSADADLGRYARWVAWDDPAGLRTRRFPLARSGTILAGCAIVIGSVVAAMLPGFGDQALYELRGLGGTTLTSNPIVGIRQRLVATDAGPVLSVRSPRPMYIRTTSLDVYSEREEWTNAGINGTPVEGPVPPAEPMAFSQEVEVDVEVLNLPEAVLVPLPYQTVEVSGEATRPFQYDRGLATFTLERGASLRQGDSYHARAAIPSPTAEELNSVFEDGVDPQLTALPANVPPRVAELSREIVDQAGAETRFEQALAVQNELRGWAYSLDVAEGHSGPAISSFLETRTGYCEQYAGTMAVMLRTLGIPARVAVGFTPGTPTGTQPAEPTPAETEDFTGDPDRLVLESPGRPPVPALTTYTVTFANAHAWVEVLFPGLGWIAFEPTPRSDQDVLVPTASNLAPSATLRDIALGLTGADDQVIDDNLNLGVPLGEERPQDPLPLAPLTAPGGQSGGLGSLWLWGAVALVAVVLLAGGLWVWRVRRAPQRSPVERVLRARRRIDQVGAGLRAPSAPWETDEEYLGRLVGVGNSRRVRPDPQAQGAADTLARRSEQARWAPALPEGAAEDAEAAAGALRTALLEELPSWRRGVVGVRGPVTIAARWVAQRRAR